MFMLRKQSKENLEIFVLKKILNALIQLTENQKKKIIFQRKENSFNILFKHTVSPKEKRKSLTQEKQNINAPQIAITNNQQKLRNKRRHWVSNDFQKKYKRSTYNVNWKKKEGVVCVKRVKNKFDLAVRNCMKGIT